jgi:hypothetical protein
MVPSLDSRRHHVFVDRGMRMDRWRDGRMEETEKAHTSRRIVCNVKTQAGALLRRHPVLTKHSLFSLPWRKAAALDCM